MASSSLNTSVISPITASVSSFTFTNPIKLDRSNYTIWKSQILSSVRANELEGLLDGSKLCPNQFLSDESGSSDNVVSENYAYTAWKKQDQMLLSWLFSSINVEILSLVVNSKSSRELWISLEQQFGYETAAKKVHLKMMLNNLKKRSMTITEYFGKLRTITDELAVTGSLVSSLDFITHLISGLGQPYYPVVVYIKANVLRMSINKAYSMLLIHETRQENDNSNASKEIKMNYAVNVAQAGNHQKKQSNNGGWNNNNQGNWNGNSENKNANGNWNGNFNNRGGFGSGRGGFFGIGNSSGQNSGRGWNANQGRGGLSGNGGFSGPFNGFGRAGGKGSIICQICFKYNHSAADCRDRFNRNFVPNFPVQGYFPMN